MLGLQTMCACPLPTRGPREQLFLDGTDTLGDIELLSLLLGTGTRGESAPCLAARLLHECDGLRGLTLLGLRRLAAYRGIGVAKASRVMAALELGRRVSTRPADRLALSVASARDVFEWAGPLLGGLPHEEVWLLCLNAKNHVLSRHRIGVGGLHGCALTPKDVLRPALCDAANGIVLVHNHPSGDPTPSHSDIQMTQVLANAARLLGLQLLDHVVVSTQGFASLYELGSLPPGHGDASSAEASAASDSPGFEARFAAGSG